MLSSLTSRFVPPRKGRACQVIDLARYRYRINDLRAELKQGGITVAEYQQAREELRDELLNDKQADAQEDRERCEWLMPLLFVLSMFGSAYLFYNWLDRPSLPAKFAEHVSSDARTVINEDDRQQQGVDLPASGRSSIGNHPGALVSENAEGLSR